MPRAPTTADDRACDDAVAPPLTPSRPATLTAVTLLRVGLFNTVGRAIGGLFGYGTQAAAAPAPPQRPNGGDGVMAWGGYLSSPEANPRLVGPQKWITYANAVNAAIVATGVRYRCDLLAGTKWSAQPNDAGGPEAVLGAEIVTRGLLKARMGTPWGSVVRKASLYKLFGFSLHEWTADRVGLNDEWAFTGLHHRPQYTIDRWEKPSEQEPWSAIGQRTIAGHAYVVPRNRLFYCVDSLLTEQPDGVGLLRHIVDLVDQVKTLEGIEGFAFETDLRGVPIGRAPLRELLRDAEAEVGKDAAKIAAHVSDRTVNLRNFLLNIVKSPEKLQSLFLDSSTYQGTDPNTISSIRRWEIELLKGEAAGLTEIDNAIRRRQLEMARVLGIEFAMMGADGAGSFALSADKTTLFATSLQTTLTEMAAFATNDLAAPLVGLAGLDVRRATPTLVAQPISTEAVAETCRALQLLSMAALAPDDPARDIIRERLHLPPEPELAPEMLGALRRGPQVQVPGFVDEGGSPDPASSEEDAVIDEAGVVKTDRTIAALLDKLAPSGKCAGCSETGHRLEIDHVDGRNWDPAALSRKQRAIKYWEEYDDGVKLQALCRSCNASDGAKNKQEH